MNRWSGYFPGSHYNLGIDFNQGNGVPYVEFFDDPNTAVDESDATDPAQWELAQLYDNGQKDSGDAFTWTADAVWDVQWGSEGRGISSVGFGLRYDDRSARETSYFGGDRGCWASPTCAGSTYEDFPGLVGVITNHFDGKANALTSWAIPTQKGLLANQDEIRAAWGNDAYPVEKVYDNDFDITETLTEAYIQADFEFDLSVNSFIDGRVGFRWVDQETDMSFPDPDGGFAKDTNSNSTVLPSLMVRWGITNNLMARFAYTEVFELPSFTQLSPNIQYFADVTDIGYGTATGGNPDLEPIESQNTDISLEWYFTEGSVLYGTYFRRDITNNIVGFRNAVRYDDPNDNPDRGEYTYILSQPDNAGESTLDGFEFGLTWFPELPGWFNGLGIQASYTMLDSEQEIPVTDEEGNITEFDILPIGGVSEDSYSVILAYDRTTFNMRLSYFWRDDFYSRNEAALFANPLQIWKGEEESLDFQATWNVTDRWTLTFDATNLTDPIYNENYGNNPQIFNFLNHYYSRTYSLGLRFQM
jgi:TonB-dependent receptor